MASSQSSSSSLTNSSLLGSASSSQQPYLLYAISSRPPTDGGNGGAHGRDPIQVLCPYTGSNVTSAHPLRVPVPSTKGGAFGVKCLTAVPLANMMGGGGDDVDSTLFVGHGGAAGGKRGAAGSSSGSKDDHAFLLSQQSSGASSSSSATNPQWKVRLPETLSSTPQSMAVSPDGRYLAAGSTNGTCFLWEWTAGEDNLVKVWKAHYRPVTCMAFDKDDGATLFTAGEDGVVNAWCTLDLVDQHASSSIHPFQTWSEHHLPVTSLCILTGSGRGSTRLVSSSLDRNLIVMELGGANSSKDGSGIGARTLARMCLPSGLHTLISDSSSGRLYGGGSDGNIYCVDLVRHAIQETMDGAPGIVVNVNQSNVRGGTNLGDFESFLSGSHVPTATSTSSSGFVTDQSRYVSELKGHAKAVTSLALLDPADLTSSSPAGKTALLASGSDDGTLRIWDLNSRSCIKVMRPWSPTSEGLNITSSATSSSSSPPITTIIAVPKSSLSSSGSNLAISSATVTTTIPLFRSHNNRRGNTNGDLASFFKPLKRFLRGTSVVSHDDGANTSESLGAECTPIICPSRDKSFVHFWENPMMNEDDTIMHPTKKRARRPKGDANDKLEIARLKKELAESQLVIERWQMVNNQLVSKLKSKG